MVEIEPGLFKIADTEDIHLSGTYDLKLVFNKNVIRQDVERNILNQEIYNVGKVMYRTETEIIDELIDIFIRYTYDPCADLDLDFSVAQQTIIRGGTVCPAKRVLFAYRGKTFVAYGRYIFGYAKYGYETIKRVPVEVQYKYENDVEDDDSEVESDWSADECYQVDHEPDCCTGIFSDNDSLDECYASENSTYMPPDLISNTKIVLRGPMMKDFVETHGYYYSFMIYDTETLVADAFGLYL